ncbi:MAG: FkbM family methyltransferase, partial [Schwartzia sp.]|nr:FkbM family methyltransferase [Schwartzia sp. (in: firmicutes)]
ENETGELLSLPQYFPREIRERLGRDEVFYDCGAYIGDTTEAFLKQTKGAFRAVYAFEMDPVIFDRMTSNPSIKDKRISNVPFGVSDRNELVKFTPMPGGDGSSYVIRFSGNLIGDGMAQLRSLDSLRDDGLLSEPATFVKMDIEGAEMDALQGMQQMMLQYRPKLAVCVYHKPEDLWEIPLFIHQMVPEYKLILRQHSPLMDNDTVLYAF